jgi:hypothetical protein
MPDITAARPVAGQPIETVWGQQIHDAVESTFVQAGTVLIPAGSGQGLVTFSAPFATTPTVVGSAVFSAAGATIIEVSNVTELGCDIRAFKVDNAAPASDHYVYWIAVGR